MPGRGAATTLAMEQEPAPLTCEGVPTLWVLMLSGAGIREGLQGLRRAWDCTLLGGGREEAAAWHSK